MNVAIIGAGLIGKKRALAMPANVNLKTFCDINEKKGQELTDEFGCNFEKDWKVVLNDKEIEAVFICTTNNYFAKISIEAIKAGKHISVEKPGAKNSKELEEVYKVFKKSKVVLQYGYNLRFHPAIIKAKELVDCKKFGEILFLRARYGHGGRLGYEKEWRFNKSISGGGELLDQGSHLIDLVNFFCGQMEQIVGLKRNLFWKASVEDSAFFTLSNKKGQIAHLSATCIEWKNIFSLEIILKKAKIQIDGLGGSYGKEKMTLYKMKPEMGLPDMEQFTFDEDSSWNNEIEFFLDRIKRSDFNDKSIQDAIYVLKTIEKL